MKRFWNGLAVLMICLGLGLGALCVVRDLWPPAEPETPVRTEAEADEPEPGEPEPTKEEASESPAEYREKAPVGLAYSLLDGEAQNIYAEVLETLEAHAEERGLSTVDEEVLARAFEAVISDHGEIFWIDGYRYVKETLAGQTQKIRFQPSYTMTLAEREAYQEQVARTLASFLYGIKENSTDYEKTKAVYENLIRNVRYNEGAAENQNILSVFLGGQSVCSGVAASMQYLLTLADVPCMTVYGCAEGENHAWNLAIVDGEPYYTDVTWGINATAALGAYAYEYLNLTDEDLAATHTVEMSVKLPVCTSRAANYYVAEGLYFETFEETAAGNALAERYAAGETSCALRFADADGYAKARQAFVADAGLGEYCTGITIYQYMENESLRVLSFGW